MQDNGLVIEPDTLDAESTPNKRRKGLREKHIGVRRCSHCGRTFKRTEHLERHVRTREFSLQSCNRLLRSLIKPDNRIKIRKKSPSRATAEPHLPEEIFSHATTG